MLIKVLLVMSIICLWPACAQTAVYYVDYESGNDQANGTSAERPWQHCPGDDGATGKAAACRLQAGDTVRFKGGVIYRGSISVASSGLPGSPIVFEGKNEGIFGEGAAILDGGRKLSGWQRCAGPEEAGGNPLWKEIFYCDINHDGDWRAFNLSDHSRPLPVAQSPNPKDPMFQDRVREFYEAPDKLRATAVVSVYLGPGTWPNKQRPASNAIKPDDTSAVVSPCNNAAIHVATNRSHTITSFGISMVKQHTQIKTLEFFVDKKKIAAVQLKKGESGMQRFQLDKPVTGSDFGFRLAAAWEASPKNNFTAVRQVAAWNESGRNILEDNNEKNGDGMTFSDPERLTATDPDYYNDMTFAVHAGHNFTFYLGINGFDPDSHTLQLTALKDTLYNKTKYSLLNSVKLIDVEGEYALLRTGEGKARLYLMPREVRDEQPVGISRAVHERAFYIKGRKNIQINGFKIMRQSGAKTSPVDIQDSSAIRITDCEITLASGLAGIHAVESQYVEVRDCRIHHLPTKTRGLRFSDCKNADVVGCTIERPTGTALVYVNTDGGHCSQNKVSGFHGMHSNGLTFYVKCKNLTIDRNYVFNGNGNVPLTIQDAEHIVIKNNIFDGDGGMAVGLWVATPFRDIKIIHNTIVNCNPNSDWQVGIFSNNKKPEDLIIQNNIIDGVSGNLPAAFSNNLYLRDAIPADKRGEHAQFAGIDAVLSDWAQGDFRLRPDSPAIDAGRDLGISEDFAGNRRPQGAAPDIGAYERP